MITLYEAVRIINEVRPEFDMVQEFEDSYIFYNSEKGEAIDDIGGANMPIVIAKEDGRCIRQLNDEFSKYAKVKVGELRRIEEIADWTIPN